MRMPYYLLTKASFSTLANYAQDQNVITWSLLFKLFSALLSIVPIKCEERREEKRKDYNMNIKLHEKQYLEVENEGMMFVEILVCRHTMELPIRN